jgi:hypothetical protein
MMDKVHKPSDSEGLFSLGEGSFSSSCHPDQCLGLPTLLSSGYQEVKQQWYEADQSPKTSSEIKKTWIYTSTLPHIFMA